MCHPLCCLQSDDFPPRLFFCCLTPFSGFFTNSTFFSTLPSWWQFLGLAAEYGEMKSSLRACAQWELGFYRKEWYSTTPALQAESEGQILAQSWTAQMRWFSLCFPVDTLQGRSIIHLPKEWGGVTYTSTSSFLVLKHFHCFQYQILCISTWNWFRKS